MRNLCVFVESGLLLGVMTAVLAVGCQARPESDGDAGAAASSKAVELFAKEQELAARERALNQAEKEGLAQKEQDLANREAELDRKAREEQLGAKAAQPASPPSTSDEAAATRVTTITVQLRINMTKPDGHAWDVGGGAPDPEVTLRPSNGAPMAKRFSDTLTPVASFKVQLKKGDQVTIEATDKDALASDPIGSLTVTYPGRKSTQSGELGAAKAVVVFSE